MSRLTPSTAAVPRDRVAGTPLGLASWQPAAVTTRPTAIGAGMQPPCASVSGVLCDARLRAAGGHLGRDLGVSGGLNTPEKVDMESRQWPHGPGAVPEVPRAECWPGQKKGSNSAGFMGAKGPRSPAAGIPAQHCSGWGRGKGRDSRPGPPDEVRTCPQRGVGSFPVGAGGSWGPRAEGDQDTQGLEWAPLSSARWSLGSLRAAALGPA